ncbi:hypothetical protein IJ541_06225, partial [bacterium]|nr:hypothetical protein [bacterium]
HARFKRHRSRLQRKLIVSVVARSYGAAHLPLLAWFFSYSVFNVLIVSFETPTLTSFLSSRLLLGHT